MASRQPPSRQMNAIQILRDDHEAVQDLFAEFKRFQENEVEGADDLKQELIDEVCNMLKVHTRIEEEIFYPAVSKALPEEEDLLNEALVEHDSAKALIEEIQGGSASDPMTCARFLVLGEQIEHHVDEEQDEMFPKVEKSSLDLQALGKRMVARKEELDAETGRAALQGSRHVGLLERMARFLPG